jgi:nitrogen-specific signal transduction histidine kinase
LAEDFGVLKGLAMLIRKPLAGVRGAAATPAPAIPAAASLSTLLLGELLLLIGP